MPLKNRFSQVIGLSSLDVFIETPVNDNTYFEIEGLSPVLGYGKHGFRLTFKDPVNRPLLKNNSPIIFEFVDSQGEIVFSELSDIPDLSGAATAYIWIKKDPLRIAEEISDGRATLYVVGELEGVPDNYKGRSNLRSSFSFNIRKDFPNISPILFYDVDGLLASASFSESLELDAGSDTFARGYINVSSSHLQTQGGKVAFGELSFRETGSRTEEFKVLSQYPLTGNTTVFETSATGSEGTSPLSHIYKTPIPKDIRRDTPVVFKLKFLDENKSPAKYYDENRVNQDIEITSSIIVINGTPTIIEKEDNLLKGSMFTGDAVGKGFEQSGKSSAFLKTVDYTGFKSASLGIGSGGVMFFSGSVLSGSGDDYDGVGLELFATTESFFKFRSNPSELDVRAAAFFVGSEKTQFISASGGNIEISSSGFHLGASGNLTASNFLFAGGGTIGSDVEILADLTANQIRTPAQINGVASTTANASSSITSQGFASFKSASIGGFEVSETQINSANEKIILKSNGQISASSMLLSSGSFVLDPDSLTRFGANDFASFFIANDTGVRIQTSNFNLNTQRFIISSSDVGVMAVGSTPPLSHTSGSGFFVDGDGNFLVGKAAGPRIQFDGFQTVISSSTFLLGGGEQFVSGSNGNIEISSSNFHLQPDGDVVMAGTITATAGAIGGFTIDSDEIKSGTNIGLNSNTKTFSINNPTYGADGIQLQFSDEIGRPRFHVGNGSSNFLKFDGTTLDVRTNAFFVGNQNTQFISGSNNIIEISSSNFHLSSSGDVVVAGNITATTGEIGGFTISSDALSSDNFFISGAATNTDLFISASSFNVDARGVVTASALSLEGGDVGGLVVAEGTISVGDILKLKDSGQITGSSVLFTGGKVSGSGIDIIVPKFFLGSESQFVSGSSGNIEISSSNFHLDNAGNVNMGGTIRATSGTIGGFSIGDDLSSTAGTLKLKGATGQITASSTLLSGNLDVTGTGTIASFTLDSDEIKSTNDNLRLKSSGQISASEAQITGKITAQSGTIGGFNIGTDLTNSAGTTLNLKGSSGQITASAAQITGKITAESGTIGGFNIGTNLTNSAGNTLNLKGSSGQITASAAQITGKITAETGTIGGFNIGTNLESSAGTLKLKGASGQITGSDVLFNGGTIGGFDIDSTTLSSNTNNLRLDSSNKFISIFDSTFGNTGIQLQFNGGTPRAFIGKAGGGFIKFNSSDLQMSSSTFFLGNTDSFISGSSGNIKISGSAITLDTPKFFLGGASQFISGSDGNIEISSSNFHLNNSGDVNMAGTITATAGTIGGFNIGTNLESSAGTLKLKGGTGQITGSDVLFNGGVIGGFDLSSTKINSSNNNLILSSSGVISASQVLFTGGKIAGWTISGTTLLGNNATLDGAGSALFKTDAGPDTDNSAATDELRNEFYIDFTPEGQGNTRNFFVKFGPNFMVDSDGILIASGATFEGTISASRGIIGGFTTDENAFHDLNNNIFISGSPAVGGTDNSRFMFISSSNFNVKQSGDVTGSQVLFTGGKIADFDISSTEIRDSDLDLRLKSSGQITGSNVLFDGGKIGGFTIDSDEIKNGTNIGLNSATKALTINDTTFGNTGIQLEFNNGTPRAHIGRSAGQGITFDGTNIEISSSAFLLGNADNFISGSTGNLRIFSTGETTLSGSQVTIETPNFFFGSPSQFISGSNNNIEISSSNFHLDKDGSIDMQGTIRASAGLIGGFTINSDTITATNFTLSPAGKFISLGSGDTIFIADADTGIQLGDATFNDAPFSVTTAGVLKATSGTVGGFTLSSNRITSNNLIMDSTGVLETADFATGVKGWRISSEGNGEAEFENVKIRGTLATAVFEKETVNAVGGQLYVANSTAITGSGQLSASNTTMSVVNVSGFVPNEVLSLKKVSDTGFTTEYVLIQSSSRDDNTSDTNFAGKLFVQRGYGSGSVGDSGSLGGTPANSQSYEPGQILVSTGKEGTGYIRLNANPSDDATPFIDIVERTGSGIYDVDLKARLGDLSGLSTARLQGTSPSSAGFGLYSQNVFLEGGIVANTGSIAGIKMQSGKLFIGTGTHNNDNTAFFADSSGNFSLGSTFVWNSTAKTLDVSGSAVRFNTGQFLLGGGSQFISGSSGNIEISSSMFHLDPKNNKVAISGSITATDGNIGGFEVTDSLIKSSNNALILTKDGTITGSKFLLQGGIITSDVTIEGDLAANSISTPTGGSPKAKITSAGFAQFVSASIGGFDVDSIRLSNPAQTFIISSSNVGAIRMGANPPSDFNNGNGFFADGNGKFLIGSASGHRVQFDGNDLILSSSKFFLGDRGSSFVSGSNGIVEISSSNFHLARNGDVVISGDVTADTGNIGGFVIDSDEIKSGTNISLNSSTKALTINNATFGNTGIQLQFNDGTPRAFIGQTSGPHVKFDGTNVSLSSSAFNLGNADNFISGSSGNLKIFSTDETTLSGSSVTIETPKFFFGSPEQFISGSSGNIEITSSMFHLDPKGNKVSISGSITATDGLIGGFVLGANTISTTGALIGDSTQALFLSSSIFKVDHVGNVTASNVDLSGKITATSGEIGGFTIDDDEIKSTNLLLDSNNEKITVGSSNAIKIQGGGTDNFIAMGSKSTFGDEGSATAGIIIGMDDDNPQAEFVKNPNNYFIFDDGVDIKTDTLLASGSNIQLHTRRFFFGSPSSFISGSNDNLRIFSTGNTTLSGSSVNIHTPKFFFGDTTQFVSGSNGNIEITSSMFHLDPVNNKVAISGSITATDGLIGGFVLGANTISTTGALIGDSTQALFLSSSVFKVDHVGNVTASNVDLSGKITATSGEVGGFDIGTNTISTTGGLLGDSSQAFFLSSSKFQVDHVGNVTASNVDLSGKITATSGEVGGFTIDDDEIKSGTNIGLDSNLKKFTINDTTFGNTGIQLEHNSGNPQAFIGKSNGGFVKFAGGDVEISSSAFLLGQPNSQFISGSNGNIEISSSKFHLQPDGDIVSQDITASNANVSGKITAESGTIGGFNIGTDLDSTAGTLKLKGATGQITASDAQITGKVTAQTGAIGGFDIGTNLESQAGTLNLKGVTGQITGSDVLFDGGKIGGFTIDSDEIKSGTTFILDSDTNDGMLKIGASGGPGSATGTDTGVYLAGDGNWALVKDAQNRIFNDGTNLVLKSEDFSLSGSTTLAIDIEKIRLGASATTSLGFGSTGIFLNKDGDFSFVQDANNFIKGGNSNFDISSENFHLTGSTSLRMDTEKIRLGNNANLATLTAGDGIFMDKDGNFRAGNATGSRIQYDGTDLILSSSKFFLGGGSNFISSSNGIVEISSSKFHLSRSGDVVISGDITATTGNIGGFNIGSNTLSTTGALLGDSTQALFLSSSVFKVDHVGNVTASNVDLSGKITATSGNIGGFTINSPNNSLIGANSGNEKFRIDLESSDMVLNGDDAFAITLGGDASNDYDLTSNTIPIQMGHAVSSGRTIFRVGSATNFLKFDSGGTFELQNSGTTTLSGSAVNITTPKFFLGSPSQFVSGSNGNIEITSSMFHLDPANNVVNISGSITATDGNIGGFVIDSNSLIRESLLADGDAFVTASIRLETAGLDGLPLIQLGAKSGSRGAGILQVSKPDGAELRLGHMLNGFVQRKIYMTAISASGGASAAIQTNQMTYGSTNNTGFILQTSDNNGDRFQIGSVSGPHIQFSSQDDRLVISSSTFLLGGGGQFISGSGGNIEISSSNFHLSAEGNVTASGLLILSGSGDVLLDRTGNLVGGRVSGEPVGDLKASADLAKGALETSGSSFKIKSGISLDDNTLVGGLNINTIKSNANNAKTVTDNLSSDGTNLTANVTGNINGTAASTVQSRATTAPDSFILYADTKIAVDDMDSSSPDNSTITGFRTYTEDGSAKTKIVVAYLCRDNDVTLKLSCLAHHNAAPNASQEGQITIGYRDVTTSYVSTALPTLDASGTITVGKTTTSPANASTTLDIRGLTAGNVYEVSVRITGGNQSSGTARSVIMQGVVISVLGDTS